MSNQKNTFQAGVAQRELPANAGLDLSGYALRKNPAIGVHDPVFARALALCDEKTLLLLLTADVLGFERPVVLEARERIEQRLREQYPEVIGTRSISILLAATHTHSAPASMTLHGCGNVDEKWLRQCVDTLVETATAAVDTLQAAQFGFGSGEVQGVAINRRTPAWNGTPDDSRTPLPLDEEVGVWRIEAEDGEPLACVVNFSCHPVILDADSYSITAEYPGVVCHALQDRLGATTLFFTGAAADINPARRGTWAEVEWAAMQIAEEASQVWSRIETQVASLKFAAQELRLPLLPLPARDELEKMREGLMKQISAAQQSDDALGASVAATYLRWSEAALQAGPDAPGHDVEVQLFRVGEAVLVALPGEVFVALGLKIKELLRAQGFRHVLVVGYANANPGYIPTREAYARGGYEVETAHRFYGHLACAAPEAGEALVESAQKLGATLR